jgi:hypothetical protein
MGNFAMKKLTILTGAVFAFICMMAVPPALAEPVSGLEGLGKHVSDQELGNMRGKFVAPSGIAYFGIAMTSSWQGADGITTSANLLFSIDFAGSNSGQPMPHLMVSWSRECAECGDSSMDVSAFGPSANGSYVALTGNGASIPVGALDSATGAVQTQQITGSDNQSRNAMTIEIVPADSIVNNTTGMTPLTSTESQHFSDGDTLQFDYSNHGVGIVMTDQSGALRQGVNGDLGQLAQHMLISGNDIVASNNMNLTIGIDPNAAAHQLNVQNALSAMKGLGF